ncbi:MAG: cytochrome c maturation protein CcmE [Bacteroidota bacterium]
MKRGHLLALVIIAVASMVIISTVGDASSYVSFKEAKDIAEDGSSKKIHVVGQLKKNIQGEVVGVVPSSDRLSVSFVMVDQENVEQQVYYNEPMPSDLLISEQVVVVGNYKNDLFVADKILLKCPSKYEEEEIKV